MNGKSPLHPDNSSASAAEQMPIFGQPAPVSTQLAVAEIPGIGRLVAVSLHSVNGIAQYFFEPAHARMLGKQLQHLGTSAETGLLLPPNPGGLAAP